MSLKYILLGMLNEPASGYDLKDRFQNSVQHFWAAELAQIYPLLGKMEEMGWLNSQAVNSSHGPPRKLYARTDTGLAALVAWLNEGPEFKPDRIPWLAQVFFLNEIPSSERSQFIRQLKAKFEIRLAALEQIEHEWQQEDSNYPDQLADTEFYPQLTLQLGMSRYRATIQWCDECLQRISLREK